MPVTAYLDWRILLAPAEQIARFGEPLTRASAAAYAAGGEALLAQTEARGIFTSRGSLPVEDQAVLQPDLADVLAVLRLNGAGAMYKGPLAERLVQAVQLAGGSLVRQDLRNFKPIWQPVTGVQYGNDRVYFAPAPAGAGLVAGQMWQMLAGGKRYARADKDERYHMLAETARMAYAGRARWLADDGTNIQPEIFCPRKRRTGIWRTTARPPRAKAPTPTTARRANRRPGRHRCGGDGLSRRRRCVQLHRLSALRNGLGRAGHGHIAGALARAGRPESAVAGTRHDLQSASAFDKVCRYRWRRGRRRDCIDQRCGRFRDRRTTAGHADRPTARSSMRAGGRSIWNRRPVTTPWPTHRARPFGVDRKFAGPGQCDPLSARLSGGT